MQIFINSKPDLDKNTGVAVALGTFDGLHRGHAALINELKAVAGVHSLHTLVYTFTSIPSELFSRSRSNLRLFTLEEKIAAFEKTGIDYLVLTDFDKKYASVTGEDFIQTLKTMLNMEYLVVGFNFTYGKNATGNMATIKKEAERFGFKADIIDPVFIGCLPVSSSRIREVLQKGDVEEASLLLGRNYSVCGTIIEGKHFGRSIGFPTVNLKPEKEKLLPLNGVYVTQAYLHGAAHPAITNIGYNPTVNEGKTVHVETHILDFEKKVYGERVKVEFLKRIRNEIKFKSKEMLKEQIEKDITEAEEYFRI